MKCGVKKGNIPWNKGLKGFNRPNKTSFKKGIIPWNKGLNHSTQTRERMSLSARNRGKKQFTNVEVDSLPQIQALKESQKIISLYLDSSSTTDIAKIYSVSRTFVLKILKQNGIKRRSGGGAYTKTVKEKMRYSLLGKPKKYMGKKNIE